MEANALLEGYLKDLRLPAFLRNYRQCAEDAAQGNQGYDRYLLALCTERPVSKIPLPVREIAFARLRKDQKRIERGEREP